MDFEIIGRTFNNAVKGFLDIFGLGTPIFEALGASTDEKKVEKTIKDINRLRIDRNNKISTLEELANILNINDIQTPGALSQAISREKEAHITNARKELSDARTNDELARTMEERLISAVEKPRELGGIISKPVKEEINRLKENINGIQEKFSEERL